MHVIPVIDLMGGQVVRGIAGRRESYRPVESRIASNSQPATIARVFVESFGLSTVYVADLDAITQGRADLKAWREIAAIGPKLWLDAGIGNIDAACDANSHLALIDTEVRLVVGLETLETEDDLFALAEMFAAAPPIFSLDMKAGQPLVRNPAWRDFSPLEIVELANSANVRDAIVLDLADVGMNGGTRTLDLCRKIKRESPALRLIAGGGVRGVADLKAMADAGCHAALVASALHDGRLTRADIVAAKDF